MSDIIFQLWKRRKLGGRVPDFEKYVRAFWTQKLGLDKCNEVGEQITYGNVHLIYTSDGWDKKNYATNVPILTFHLLEDDNGTVSDKGSNNIFTLADIAVDVQVGEVPELQTGIRISS